jgi:hypothetical protein
MTTAFFMLAGYMLAIFAVAMLASAIDDWLSKRKRGNK